MRTFSAEQRSVAQGAGQARMRSTQGRVPASAALMRPGVRARFLSPPPRQDRAVLFPRPCQTGIIRTRFRAADFRLNRVIRFANTVKY